MNVLNDWMYTERSDNSRDEFLEICVHILKAESDYDLWFLQDLFFQKSFFMNKTVLFILNINIKNNTMYMIVFSAIQYKKTTHMLKVCLKLKTTHTLKKFTF